MIQTAQFRSCDVCRLVDFNTQEKNCNYCSLCDAWICDNDVNKWGRRLIAAAKRKLEFNYRGLPNYEEIATNKIKTGEKVL